MGEYRMTETRRERKPVWELVTGGWWLFYTRSRYWAVGRNYSFGEGIISSATKELSAPSVKGWLYATQGKLRVDPSTR